MSYRTRLLLLNNFIQSLDEEIRSKIDSYVEGDYGTEGAKALKYFGLDNEFRAYVAEYAA